MVPAPVFTAYENRKETPFVTKTVKILSCARLWLRLGFSLWITGSREEACRRKMEALYNAGVSFTDPRMIRLNRKLIRLSTAFQKKEKQYLLLRLQAGFAVLPDSLSSAPSSMKDA